MLIEHVLRDDFFDRIGYGIDDSFFDIVVADNYRYFSNGGGDVMSLIFAF